LIRNLRKGNTTIEYWHEFGSDTIRGIYTEIELKSDHAVFRTTLKPVDGNQKMDADRVFAENLSSLREVTFSDSQIREVLGRFLNAYKERINYLKLEIIYNKKYVLNTGFKPVNNDGLSFEIRA
jgi:hypothetical protein